MSMTFSTWLATCSESDFESFVRTRRDLLRPESPTLGALAAAASSRIGVSRGIECLDSADLAVAIALATAARTSADIDLGENPHTRDLDPSVVEAALPRLRDLGLAWASDPAPVGGSGLGGSGSGGSGSGGSGSGGPDADPAATSADSPASRRPASLTWRIQPEAITLLPTSAAEAGRAHPWQQYASLPADQNRQAIPAALVRNSELAAVAEVISTFRGLVDELGVGPVSRLTSGGMSKRDVSRLARSLDLGLEATIGLLLAARKLGFIGVLDDPLDPEWTAVDEAGERLAIDRARLWADLVDAWLSELLDATQLAAGASENERLTVLALPKKPLFKGFAQSFPALPLVRHTVLEILRGIGVGSSRSARWIHSRVLETHPLAQAHSFAVTEQVLHAAIEFGLATTPLQHPKHFGPSHFGSMLAAEIGRAMKRQLQEDPSIAPLGLALAGLHVPDSVIEEVRVHLVPEVDTVLIQSDLTAVATGPIAPRVHHALRRFAVVEARGQGTVYRIDTATLEASMQAGLTPETALDTLAEISAQPLPSTLEFLITNTAAKLHRVQVAGARAVLVVDDPVDLDVIIADPLMLPAGLERLAPTVAIGQLGPERTLHLLEAGEHHALLHSPTGVPRKRRIITQEDPEVQVRKRARVMDSHLTDYISAIRSPAALRARPLATHEPLGHLDRLRDAAAQKQSAVIRLADSHGKQRTIRMRPTTVNGGRVRGIVATTGAEASLSISRIISVDVPHAGASESDVSEGDQ